MSNTQGNATVQPQAGSSSKPLRAFASLLSYIFHPVFMPAVMALVLFMLARDTAFAGIHEKTFLMWLAMICLNTIGFSLLTVALMKGLGFIKSIYMTESRDRIMPLLAIMIFYFWTNHVLSNTEGVPLILHTLTLGSFWGIVAIFMVNIFYKVSMHTTAAGAMLGIMLILLFTSPVNMVLPFFIALFIAGLIGSARMILGAHKAPEIWLGYALGLAVQVGAYIYLK
ncbi:MAG TPA: hypothetical protein VEB40_13290 [Flavipsychrobacter sp.]|nr:hypothetical protein [Flavipsychrobacter sp.]